MSVARLMIQEKFRNHALRGAWNRLYFATSGSVPTKISTGERL